MSEGGLRLWEERGEEDGQGRGGNETEEVVKERE